MVNFNIKPYITHDWNDIFPFFFKEMDKMIARMDNLEEQMSLLNLKNHNQANEIDILKTEINRCTSKEEKKTS